jgi:hypothetical protein
MTWFVFVLVFIFFILALYLWNYKQRVVYIRHNIINNWGKQIKKDYKEAMESIASYFLNTKGEKDFLLTI